MVAFCLVGCLRLASATTQIVDEDPLALPKIGDHRLRILSPTLLELTLINSKRPDPARADSWDWVTTNAVFQALAIEEFLVLAEGQPLPIQSIGFKRRPLYAPLRNRDLRIANHLYLRLPTALAENQTVEVRNPTAKLWPTNRQFQATAHPLRYSPAIHVNQVGYLPGFPKTAIVHYYSGNLGDMSISATNGFKVLEAKTGAVVFEGRLTRRNDVGYQYSPRPYQNVWEADFSSFAAAGEYRLLVPGLGTSWPFVIDEGAAMAFVRAYALGLYHQRCGMANELPFTRFTHAPCHTNLAEVPNRNFGVTLKLIAEATANYASEPRHIAPRLKDFGSALYPYVNTNRLDVSGGHHDAGDYSKYTINSAALIHVLVFAADAFPKGADLDNLGLPESGDGISDLLQEAKWEADFLVKMQDADGGFYFLVYPRNRAYESNVLPDAGDPQVVWPKTTAATAAAAGALAQCASSPRFQKHYPEAAARYLESAVRGWNFLTNAIAKHGKDGAYQKLIPYGHEFMHDDELAWAACELFLATGEASYHDQLRRWFEPGSQNTWRWTWWRMFEGNGNAIRSYAFAAKTGRLSTNQLNSAFLDQCERQIFAAGRDVLTRSRSNAYGTSFPLETKRVRGAGWYFSTDQAFDLAVASLLQPDIESLRGFLYNLNFEAGCNPVNVCYITGLGWRRQREIVHQYAMNDRRVLPPSGIPLGNIQDQFPYLDLYGGDLGKLTYPSDGATYAPYAYYDRWADTFNVTTEFTIVNLARSLAGLALLASQTYLNGQPWKPALARIVGVPAEVSTKTPVTARLEVAGLNLHRARVVWEASYQEPAYGANFTLVPTRQGVHWLEAEAQWPDGRRVFATAQFFATNRPPVEPPVEPPTITFHPLSQEVAAGTDATFQVAAGGSTPIQYQWQFNGLDIPGATTNVLAVKDAQPAREGHYRVIVSNSVGSITSNAAELKVKPPSVPQKKPPSIYPIPNQKTSMNRPTPAIPLIVGSNTTPPQLLTVTVDSSNPGVVPDDHILFSGSGTERSMVVVPAANQSGMTVITVIVADGPALWTSASFVLQVYPSSRDGPFLGIQHIGGRIVLSWPTNTADFFLEAGEGFPALAQWSPLKIQPEVVGGRYAVTIEKPQDTQFFRLSRE